jgi:hypothetical protein
MIPQIKELNFPEYATLSQATVTLNDMGERTISAQVKIDGEITPDFSYDWEVEFMGEKYIHTLRSPQALKDNTSICSKIDLVFQHWAIYQMKRFYFVELASTNSGTAIADKYIASLGLNLGDFIVAFRNVLDYYFKGAITIDFNPEWQASSTPAYMNISYSYIWDVLQQIYEVYGVRWAIEGNTIKVGYPTSEISHIFEYGYDKGLLSIERQVQDTNIRNSLLGRGGSTNLPQYYFKNAPEDSLYASDPDAIPELANIYFSELRGKTFRDYVKGWKVAHYGAEPIENPTDAYLKGFTDTDFNPIETIEDNDSIKKYGLLPGGLENNEDIYPSIQDITLEGIGLVNEVVAVEPVLSDDVDSTTNQKAIISDIENLNISKHLQPNEKTILKVEFPFIIKDGYKGSLFFDTKTSAYGYTTGGTRQEIDSVKFAKSQYYLADVTNGGILDSLINIPSGDYVIQIQCEVSNPANYNFIQGIAEATLEVSGIKLSQSRFNEGGEEWKPTFDIWVKNIWQTSKLANETEQEYADRVWLPILGDEGREAMVVFSSGWLSSSSDWDFMIVKGGYAYDTSKSHNGVPSHWRLTLQKSDAEIKATDKYIPNMGMQAIAGDTFFFTGIDMQHQYVLFAEQRIDEWKADNLLLTKDITPTWVAKFDKVRINTLEANDADLLVNQIKIGSSLRLADKRFIDSSYIEVYVQSITYNYSSSIIPDIEVVLSNEVATVKNPVEQIQSNINVLSRQIGSISNIQQLVRQIGDKLYLRKDGIEDYSNSPTQFNSIVKGANFRSGAIGGASWGIYKDGNGNTIAEFDKLIARKDFVVNNLIINQASYVGGMQINSAAAIECTNVEEVESGYKCYFDQKQGSVVNLFKVDDVAYCQRYFLKNESLKFYKRKVVEVGDNYIILSNSVKNGDGIPTAQDNIIHFGNYSDKERQYVIIRDVVGGGYERMLSGLNSVDANGVEYYFAGRMNNGKPRWFVGDTQGEYAEWEDGKMRIKGKLEVGSDVGGATVVDGGLVTAETISLGTDEIKAGITGVGDTDEDIRFWAGTTFEERVNAPFRVNQKGQVVMTDANVSGTVNATNGVFKGSLAFKYQELPQGDEVSLSFESGFNFAGVEAWDGNGNPYKTLILPSFGTSYNGVKCTIINNGFGFSVNGESAYPYKYFKVKTQNNFAFLHNSMNRYADSEITEVWIEAGRLVTFTATILDGIVKWVIENEDGLKPIQANTNVLRGNGMPQPYVFWAGEIDTQKDAAGFYQTPYSFMGYSDDIDVEMDSFSSKFNVTFRTEMSDEWIYVPQITSMGATTFSIEDKSNSGFNIRMDGKIQLTILMLRSTIIF